MIIGQCSLVTGHWSPPTQHREKSDGPPFQSHPIPPIASHPGPSQARCIVNSRSTYASTFGCILCVSMWTATHTYMHNADSQDKYVDRHRLSCHPMLSQPHSGRSRSLIKQTIKASTQACRHASSRTISLGGSDMFASTYCYPGHQ